MIVRLRGHRTQNPRFCKLVRHVIKYTSGILLEKRTLKKLRLTIRFVKNLYHKDDAFGDCFFNDSSYRPRNFTINIDPCRSISSIASTLIHEFTHVQQFTTGNYKVFNKCLGDNDDGLHRWKTKMVDTIKTDYYDYPWEKHAFKMEDKIFKTYSKTKFWKKHSPFLPSLVKRREV